MREGLPDARVLLTGDGHRYGGGSGGLVGVKVEMLVGLLTREVFLRTVLKTIAESLADTFTAGAS